jgi:hypothetical protein
MLKKILGIILIIISVFLGFVFLIGIPENIMLIIVSIKDNSEYSFGYAIGNSFVWVLLLVISIVLFKLGFKLIRISSKKTKSINQIGKN